MKNNDQPSMFVVKSLARFLVETWRESKCPYTDAPAYACTKCEYNVLCSKIDELAKVVGR